MEEQVKYGCRPEERSKTAQGQPGTKPDDRRLRANEIDTEIIRQTDLKKKNREHA